MVQEIARDSAGDVVHVIVRIHASDLEYLSAGKTFPIEADGIVVGGVSVADEGDEFDKVGDDVDVLRSIDVEGNDGGGK